MVLPPAAPRRPRTRRPRLLAILAFLAILAIGAGQSFLAERHRISAKQAVAKTIAANYAQRMEAHISRSLSATYALAAMVRQSKGRVVNFELIATDMLKLYGDIDSLQLAPGGIITYVVPLAGNEKAVGHDLLKDEKRNKEAIAAMNTRKLTLAGPFDLIQGGVAIIGRLPIFLPEEDGKDSFWGFSTAMIRIPGLLKRTRIQEIADQGYLFELWRIHPDTGERHVFASSGGTILASPVSHEFEVPNGTWTLSLEPEKGWTSWAWIALEAAIWLVVGALIGQLTFAILRE